MAIEKGVTEVADSEDDPMTSSPGVVSDEAADKLRAMSCGPYQERQDALHDADGLHQASAERDANASEILGGDPIDASTDGYASKIDQTNMTLHETSAAQKGEGASLEGGSDDRGLHPQVHTRQPESTSRDISNVPHVTVVSAKHLEAVVVQEVESDLPGGEEQRSTSSHTVQGSAEKKISEAAQPTVMDAPSKAPGAPVHVPSDSSSNSEIPNESTYQSQDNATRDTLSQESNEYLGSAAAHYLVDGHTRENVGHSLPVSTAVSIESETTRNATGSLDDAGAGVPKSSLPPATTMQDDYTSSTRRGGRVLEDTLFNSRMDIDTSEIAMIENGTSSMIGQEQSVRRKLAEQQPSVEGFALSKESADSSFDASSPITEMAAHAQPHAGAQRLPSPTPAAPSKTPQEITLDELRAQKAALLASLGALPAIQVLMEENALSSAEPGDTDDEPTESDIFAAANKIVKEHIKLLHEYNELKDVGQGLMGLIADQRGLRIVEVQEEFGIDAQD